jgi:uncharacterized protein YggU (UPF0235/DUF167 family)
VSVYAGAKNESVKNVGKSRFEVKVKEPAERNLANARVIELIAGEYEVSSKSVRIVSGHHSSRKILSVGED